MYSVDPGVETAKLRKKSPLNNRKLFAVYMFTPVAGLFFLAIFFFGNPKNVSPLFYLFFFVLSQAIGLAFGRYFYFRFKRFIDHGVVVMARVQSMVQYRRLMYHMNVEYTFEGKIYEHTFNVTEGFSEDVSPHGVVPIVIDPESPKSLEYLYMFATSLKEIRSMLSGESGLAWPTSK